MAKHSKANRNKRLALAERGQKILELAVMGISYAEIGRRFGIPESTARSIGLREAERSPDLTVQQRRKMLALRLNKVSQHASALMLSDDLAMKARGINATLQIAEREERLLELDARESKVAPTDPHDFQIPLPVLRAMYDDLKRREISEQPEPQAG